MFLAYLDPASGSMLAAAVVAGFAGAMLAVKMWSRRVINKFRRRKPAGAAGSPGGAGSVGTAGAAEAAGSAETQSPVSAEHER